MLQVTTTHVGGNVFIGVILNEDAEIVFSTPGFANRKSAYKAAQKLRTVLIRNSKRLPNPFET